MIAELSKIVEGPTAANSWQELPRSFVLKKIRRGGHDWNYLVYRPELVRYTPWPTIVCLGGSGECGSDPFLLLTGLARAIISHPERWPFVVIFPQKHVIYREEEWVAGDDMVMSIIEHIWHEGYIDESRIYLTGFSEGGRGAWEIAARHPDLFAAIAPIAGGPRHDGNPEAIADNLKDMPIWMFHSPRDNVIPISVAYRMKDLLRERDAAEIWLTSYDKEGLGHGGWDEAYGESDLPGWFLQHSKES